MSTSSTVRLFCLLSIITKALAEMVVVRKYRNMCCTSTSQLIRVLTPPTACSTTHAHTVTHTHSGRPWHTTLTRSRHHRFARLYAFNNTLTHVFPCWLCTPTQKLRPFSTTFNMREHRLTTSSVRNSYCPLPSWVWCTISNVYAAYYCPPPS